MKNAFIGCLVFSFSFIMFSISLPQGIGVTIPYASADDGFNLVISTDDGVIIVDQNGTEVGSIPENGAVEIYENRIFIVRFDTILEYDEDGTLHNTILLPEEVVYKSGFAVLPGLQFALFDNTNDKIYVIDSDGTYLTTVNIHPEPDSGLQNTDGVVTGNRLILSENGNMQILAIDLTSYETTILKSFPFLSGWLGAIDYSKGVFYVCQMRNVLSFREDRLGKTVVATVPEGNISGIVVDDSVAYVTANHAGILYRVTLSTGAVEELITGLRNPEDIEKLPLGMPTSTTTSTDPESDCLATALYGKNSEALVTLRSLRDGMLRQTPEGRELIKLYYLIGPAVVKALRKDEAFKEDLKRMIADIVSTIGSFSEYK